MSTFFKTNNFNGYGLQNNPNPTVAYIKSMKAENEKDCSSRDDKILYTLNRLHDDVKKIKLSTDNIILDVQLQLEKQTSLLELILSQMQLLQKQNKD
jgi:hypothetical protein